MKKTLCLYYTRTNTTKAAMEQVAEFLGADLAGYSDGKDRSGILGYISCCFASVNKVLPSVAVEGDVSLADYERVIIGMPVWAEGPCAVGRAFLTKYKAQLPDQVYLLVTHAGKNDYEKKIALLDELLKTPQKGHLSLRTKENEQMDQELRAFCEMLKAEDGRACSDDEEGKE